MWSWGACDGEPAAFVCTCQTNSHVALHSVRTLRFAAFWFTLLCKTCSLFFYVENLKLVCANFMMSSMTDEWSVSSTPHQVKQKIWRKKSVL